MKTACLQENLAKGLSIVSRAVASRSTLPVLGNILLATDRDNIKLSATNLEVGITCWVVARVDKSMSITVPSRTLVDLVNTMPNKQIDLRLDERKQVLNIKCGRFENNIRGIAGEEFPVLPTEMTGEGATQSFSISPDTLRDALDKVVFAAARDESRPILTGVLVKVVGSEEGVKKLVMAAADGFRLSVWERQLGLDLEVPDFQAIVPARSLAELMRVIGSGGEGFEAQTNDIAVSITPSRNQIIFKLDNVVLVSQLIDGNFPDYSPIVPKRTGTKAIVDVGRLSPAIKATSVFAREAANISVLKFEPTNEDGPGTIQVSAKSAETGDNEGVVEAEVEGPGVEIGFNYKYLQEALGAIGNQAEMHLTTGTSPVMLRPVGSNDFVHVIMPMHLANR